jgi:tetratricopeptide (TPR) repeat protein
MTTDGPWRIPMKRALSLWTHVVPIFALALVALLAGCKRDPNIQKQKYLESGERYFKVAKYREAVIQFSNAVQVDPRFAEGHYQLAQAYIKLQDWNLAYEQLEKTVELRPDHYPAHIDLANLLIASRSLDRAKEHLDVLAAKGPQ